VKNANRGALMMRDIEMLTQLIVAIASTTER
jgi:hypothetical protein